MERLDKILSGILKVVPQDLHADLTMEDVELWDSLRHMELITTIEAEFGIEFSYEELTSMLSISAIRSAVAEKVGA